MARYPSETVEEYEKNVVFRHHDNVTQWVNEFTKKRGWFVQVCITLSIVNLFTSSYILCTLLSSPRHNKLTVQL